MSFILILGRGSSYRSISPECDSPRERRDRYQSSSYSQKIRDRDYKKDKYNGRFVIMN